MNTRTINYLVVSGSLDAAKKVIKHNTSHKLPRNGFMRVGGEKVAYTQKSQLCELKKP